MDNSRDKQPDGDQFLYDIRVDWDRLQDEKKFTDQQIAMLKVVLSGKSSNPEIAEALTLSTQTVRNMMANRKDQKSATLNPDAPSTLGLRGMMNNLANKEYMDQAGWFKTLIETGYATLVPKKDRE